MARVARKPFRKSAIHAPDDYRTLYRRFCVEGARLIIEVDGDTHSAEDRYDAQRTEFLESLGYRVIRFANPDVIGNIEGVLNVIADALRASPSPQPSPPRERE